MVHTETIEGNIGEGLWFHCDAGGDVLHLRRVEHRVTPTVGEMLEGGLVLLLREDSEEVVGATFLDWWRTRGEGECWASREAFEQALEETAMRVPLAA
jgi:hypothetical protein